MRKLSKKRKPAASQTTPAAFYGIRSTRLWFNGHPQTTSKGTIGKPIYGCHNGPPSKLTRGFPTLKTTPTHMVNFFLAHLVVPFGAFSYLLADRGPQFVSRSFASLCRDLGLKHCTATAFHPQTKGQAERYDRSILTCLLHFVAEFHHYWNFLSSRSPTRIALKFAVAAIRLRTVLP